MKPATKWTLIVCTILGGTIASSVTLLVLAAGSQNRVLPDYYARAVDYSAAIAAAERSRALGWTVTPTLAAGRLRVCVADQGGAPVTASVSAEGFLRVAPTVPLRAALQPGVAPGCYDAPFGHDRGIYEVTIDIVNESARYVGAASLVPEA